MESKALEKLFPLFNAASPNVLEWLLSIATEEDYSETKTVLTEESWGGAVYFIISGWVKIQRACGSKNVTLDILGRGDFFGEMAIFDESPRSTIVVTMTQVKLLSISAQRFLQSLLKDSQLQHRMLQLLVRRVRYSNERLLLGHQQPTSKLAKILVHLGEKYGLHTEKGKEILNIDRQDLADLTDVDVEEIKKIVEKLQNKGWLEIDYPNQTLCLTNFQQLSHLARQILND